MVWQIQKKAADEDFPVVYKLFITLCKVFPPSPTTFQNALPQYAEYGKCTHKPFLKVGSLWLHVAYCIASPKLGMTSDILTLPIKLNHNGINPRETRVEQIARKLWVSSLQIFVT